MQKPNLKSLKDKAILDYIESLESELAIYKENSYVNSYLSLKKIVDKVHSQIDAYQLVMDITSEEGAKIHKLVSEFVLKLKEYEEQMEFFRTKMNPQQQKDIKEKEKLGNIGIAEKMALNARS